VYFLGDFHAPASSEQPCCEVGAEKGRGWRDDDSESEEEAVKETIERYRVAEIHAVTWYERSWWNRAEKD